MAGARFMSWHRAGPLAIAVIAWGSLPGCGGDDTNNTGGSTTTTSSSSSGGTGGMATGGTGGTGGSTGGSEPEVKALATGRVLDSTPNSTADVVYFTGSNADGTGVFSVPGAGGNASVVFVGDPFTAPLGITISGDDNTLFVADPGAEDKPDDPKTSLGAILSLAASGGNPSIMTGSLGYRPRGVDIRSDAGEETIFFTGVDKTEGKPGVFQIPAAGGAAKPVAMGAPFVDPSGIAVGKSLIFVADTSADSGTAVSRTGQVIQIDNGVAQTFVADIGVGYPTGIALSSDESTLYVSGVDPETGFDVVYIVDVATKAISPYSAGDVGKNRDAGGLHRARKSDVFSWADLSAGGTGTVYRVTFK